MKKPRLRLPRRTGPDCEGVAQARQAAARAAEEVAVSAERQQKIREKVVDPLLNAATHNQFAALLRRSLTEGDR